MRVQLEHGPIYRVTTTQGAATMTIAKWSDHNDMMGATTFHLRRRVSKTTRLESFVIIEASPIALNFFEPLQEFPTLPEAIRYFGRCIEGKVQ